MQQPIQLRYKDHPQEWHSPAPDFDSPTCSHQRLQKPPVILITQERRSKEKWKRPQRSSLCWFHVLKTCERLREWFGFGVGKIIACILYGLVCGSWKPHLLQWFQHKFPPIPPCGFQLVSCTKNTRYPASIDPTDPDSNGMGMATASRRFGSSLHPDRSSR